MRQYFNELKVEFVVSKLLEIVGYIYEVGFKVFFCIVLKMQYREQGKIILEKYIIDDGIGSAAIQ